MSLQRRDGDVAAARLSVIRRRLRGEGGHLGVLLMSQSFSVLIKVRRVFEDLNHDHRATILQQFPSFQDGLHLLQ